MNESWRLTPRFSILFTHFELLKMNKSELANNYEWSTCWLYLRPAMLWLCASLLTNMNDLLALTLLWWQSPWTWTQTTVYLFCFTFSVPFSELSDIGQTLGFFSSHNDFQLLIVLFTFAGNISELLLEWNTPLSLFAVVCLLFPVCRIGLTCLPVFLSVTVPTVVSWRPSYSCELPSAGQW